MSIIRTSHASYNRPNPNMKCGKSQHNKHDVLKGIADSIGIASTWGPLNHRVEQELYGQALMKLREAHRLIKMMTSK